MEPLSLGLDELCRAASPGRAAEQSFDLEAALAKARLYARMSGDSAEARVALGRFEVLHWLGRGGMGTVFEARDGQTGARLALKVLHGAAGDAAAGAGLSRLQREFRSLVDVCHPNLVTMYELHLERGVPFFTMALIEGTPLHELSSRGVALDAALLRACLVQLVEALHAIHARSMVHGDIKPSNLLLDAQSRLTLLDFGVARAFCQARGTPGSGTLRYMAPERLRGGPATEAWDWYAVGALLSDLLRAYAAADAHHGEDALRAELQRLCHGLLQDDPGLRFGAQEILTALGEAGRSQRASGSGEDDVFVARHAELEALREAFAGQGPRLCALHGEPGVGKSALMQRALCSARATGVLVLEGRCHQHEALPYKGFDGVVEALASELAHGSCMWRSSLPAAHEAALALVFPALRRAGLSPQPSVATAPHSPGQLRRHAFSGLAQLLGAVARTQKLVIFIDDLQWSDADGAALLEHLLLGPLRPPLVFAAGLREGEPSACAAVLRAAAKVVPLLELALAPLERAASTELARRVAPEHLDAAQLERVVHESGGNPWLLRALLAAPMTHTDAPRSVERLMRAQLERLDAAARDLLTLTVLAGGPVRLGLLQRASRLGEQTWQPLARLRNQQLVRTIAAHGERSALPHHDRVRDALLSLLPAETRRHGHARLARATLALGLDDPEFVAEQTFQAGLLLEAADHAQRAAERAQAAMAFARARDLYARALSCLAPERPAALLVTLAEAAFAAADLKTATPLFLEASEAHQGETRTLLRLRAAELHLAAGAEHEGLALLRGAGVPLPRSSFAAALLGARSLLSAVLSRRARSSTHAASPDARVETSFRVGYVLSLSRPSEGTAVAMWSAARALRKGSPAQRGRAVALLAHLYALLGLASVDAQDAMLEEALALTRSDPTAHCHALLAGALLHFTRSDCDAALAHLDATRANLAQAPTDIHAFLGHIQAVDASVCVMAGNFKRLDAFVASAASEATQYGNHAAASQLRSALAFQALAADDPQVMERHARDERARWAGRHLTPLYGLAVWGEAHRLLYCGERQAAAALRALEEARFVRSGVARMQPWTVALKFIWGTIALANSERAHDAEARDAQRLAGSLDRERTIWARGCAALLRAGLARRDGERDASLQHYTAATRWFGQVGMQGLAAAAAFRAAELRGAAEPASSRPWFATQGIVNPARWVRMVAP